MSTNVGAGSGPVHQRGRSVSDGSLGTLSGDAVRDGGRGGMRSGPVSDISVGSVTTWRPVSGGGTMSDASAGAVKKDVDSPLGERISQPVHELGPLLEQVRGIQPVPPDSLPSGQAADADAVAEAEEAPPDPEDAVPEEEEPTEPEEAAGGEEPAEADAPDVVAEEDEPASPREEPAEPAPEAEVEPPPDQDAAEPPPAEDDPRDAEERPPTPAGVAQSASR